MQSAAASVEDYLESLPEGRRTTVSTVRDVVNDHLPDGYREAMAYGMIGWGIPLEDYPDTYNGQPLAIAGLASQKNHLSLYLMGCYTEGPEEELLHTEYAARGLRLDMGKSCLRFKRLEDLPLDVIGQVVGMVPPDELIRRHEAARAGRAR
jgi:hypothetical protein